MRTVRLALLLILVIPAALCTNEPSVIVTDDKGREVEVPLHPERIVCLNAAAGEVIHALDGADRIVAVTGSCITPPSLMEKVNLGRSALSLEAEPIVALEPDLVIEGVPPLQDEVREQLEDVGIPVLRYWALHVDTVLPMIDDLGVILGEEERSQKLHDFIQDYYDLAKDRLGDLPEESRPKVYYMIMSQICWTCGGGSDMGETIEEAGGQNIASGLQGDVPEVDPEWIIEQNPDVMVYHYIRPTESETAVSPSLEELESCRSLIVSQPGFDGIKAVEEGRVYLVDTGIVTGPRQIVGLLHFAKWFHPDLFQNINPEAVHAEMLASFYDMDEEGFWAYPLNQSL